jgi:TetR/AcrR family transcriptional regulator of autoinduction and epiphytic fitness
MASGWTVPGGHDEEEFRPWGPDPGTDQRMARGSRTRALVMDAVIELIHAGNPAPTARGVAERAGIAVRTLYHHFGTLDRLFTATADRQVSHFLSLITAIPPHGPVEFRIRVLARQRRLLFEAIGPVLQASSTRTPASAALTEVLDGQRSVLRRQLARTLAPEIAAREPLSPILLDTLNAISGWPNWTTLRGESGHSAAQAEQTVVFTLTRVLG